MKCPKCHYLSFEPEPRCRNCGYSFSLVEQEVVIRDPDTPPAPLADLDLRPGPRQGPPATAAARASEPGAVAPVRTFEAAPTPAAQSTPAVTPLRPAPTSELPLFVKALSQSEPEPVAEPESDPPLVSLPADPRPPLAVRRKSADGAPRARQAAGSEPRKVGPFDRDLLEDLQRIEQQDQRAPTDQAARVQAVPADRVGPVTRAAAAAIDAVLLGGLSTALFWITLRWCDLSFTTATVLPAVPMATFLALVGAGYLLMFTAVGGQTLGKMLLGIRVVDATGGGQANVSVRQAAYRALLTLPSVLVFGLGFVPALLGDERALHDRLADTRVVRA